MPGVAQKKVFRSNTKRMVPFVFMGILLSAALVYIGYRQYLLPRTLGFPPDSLFYGLAWTVAGLILLLLLLVYLANADKSIVVTPQYMEFMRGQKVVFRCLWNNLSFTPPRQDQKRLRACILSDGKHYERVEDFFFPDFELLVDFVREAKKHARDDLSTS